jgi:hypothetical protein
VPARSESAPSVLSPVGVGPPSRASSTRCIAIALQSLSCAWLAGKKESSRCVGTPESFPPLCLARNGGADYKPADPGKGVEPDPYRPPRARHSYRKLMERRGRRGWFLALAVRRARLTSLGVRGRPRGMNGNIAARVSLPRRLF